VDGTIVVGSPGVIRLSRTLNLVDSIRSKPEMNAQVRIESEGGSVFELLPAEDGEYKTDQHPSDTDERYRIRINTSDGSEYLSAFVPVKQSPPIDSLEWEENNDIFIYVNTHDPGGNTRYYRWEFEETSQYQAF